MSKREPPYRVIQWGTGAVGKYCIQRTLELPFLEQVGARVFSDAKDGQDVGEIAHLKPTGIKAVKDKTAIYAADADIVLYTPLVVDLDDICDILASGKDLITPSGFVFLSDQAVLGRINAACEKGGSTMYAAGIHPGFAGDRVPLVLSALCRRIDKVTVYELVSMADMTESPDLIFGYLGFNMDAETAAKTPPPLLGTMSTIFKQSMQLLAAGLGIEIESFRTSHEYALTTEDSYTTPGLIKKGHVGGQHFNYEALVGDRTVIEFKTYWRMADKLEPAWDQPMKGLTYVVEIDGDPGVRCVFEPVGERPAELGLIWTAMLVMNAIPEVCKAPPGFKTTLELPLITAKHAVSL
jgi:2,4-diaminopentanoate dehydrogenase